MNELLTTHEQTSCHTLAIKGPQAPPPSKKEKEKSIRKHSEMCQKLNKRSSGGSVLQLNGVKMF